jgi:hypothetical protein
VPGWLSELARQWPQFLAVFLGAAVGAVLTVRLTNRSYHRQQAEQAFTRLHRRLWDLLQSRADHLAWRRETVEVSGDLGLVKWHTRGWGWQARRTREAVRGLSAELDRQFEKGAYVHDWPPVLKRVAALKRALYGMALDDLSESDEDG